MRRLSLGLQEELRNKPEFGMGYHLVKTDTERGNEIEIILDSEFIITLSELSERYNESTIPEEGSEWVSSESQGREDGELRARFVQEVFGRFTQEQASPEIIEHFGAHNALSIQDFLESYRNNNLLDYFEDRNLLPRKPFSQTPRETQLTRNFDGFIRVSASPNDKRINDDGSVEEGTYATTAKDFEMVPSGFSAVGRYALPDPTSARFAYPIVPDRSVNETILGGTVQPAFNQSGGGVEVQFVDGLPPGSAHPEPYIIPTI